MKNIKTGRKPKLWEAVIPIIFTLSVMLYSMLNYNEMDAHFPLFICLVFTILFAMYLKWPWAEIEEAFFKGLKIGLLSMILMVFMGMVISGWMACGTTSYIIYLGLKYMSPHFFLLTVLFCCLVFGFATGSTWTTAGTLGVAFVAVGYGLGIPAGATVGAVLSGAYFGDKQSALSETTVFAPAVSGTTLYPHIRSMLYTTTPVLIIAIVFYGIYGYIHGSGVMDTAKINLISDTLSGYFHFGPWLLIPPVLLVFLIIKKVPSLLGMIICALAGIILAVVCQGMNYETLASTMMYGFVSNTGVEVVDSMISKGGITDLMYTVALIMISLPMGGILEKTGVLEVILNSMGRLVNNVFGLVTTTLWTALALIFMTADAYLPILITGRLFMPQYDKLHVERRVLSRCLEDTGTEGDPLCPWSVGTVFFVSVLGVPWIQWIPFCFFAWLTPFVAMACAAIGFGIWYTDKGDLQAIDSERYTDEELEQMASQLG